MEDIWEFYDKWDNNTANMLHCCYDAGDTLSAYWLEKPTPQQMLLICQPSQMCVPRELNATTLEAFYKLMV